MTRPTISSIIILTVTGMLFLSGTVLYGQLAWIADHPVTTGNYNAVAVSDFNYDGLIDIAAAPITGGIEIWYRTTTGWDPAPEFLPSVNTFSALAAGDIDRDGFMDIAGSGQDAIEAYLHKYNFNDGIFEWIPAITFIPSPTGLFSSIKLANVNRTEERYNCYGFTPNSCQTTRPHGLDIIVTENFGSGSGLRVYRWAGLAGTPPNCQGYWIEEIISNLPTTGNYSKIVAADVNQDEDLDILVSKEGGIDSLFRIYVPSPTGCVFPDKNGSYEAQWSLQNGEVGFSDLLPVQGDYRSVDFIDINKDTFPDIIASGNPTENTVDSGIEIWYGKPPIYETGATQWLWDKERSIFNPAESLLIPGAWTYLETGDMNGDYLRDIVAVSSTIPVSIWKSHFFLTDPIRHWWENESPPASSGLFQMVALADFNRDGKKDMALASGNNTGIEVYLRSSSDIVKPTGWYNDVNIDQLTGEKGIIGSVRYSGTNIYSGDSGGEYSTLMGRPPSQAAYVIATEDASSDENSIRLFKTEGKMGVWTELVAPTVATGSYQDAELGYINRDDYIDIVAIMATNAGQTEGIKVWFGSATGWIEQSYGISADALYYDIELADIDGDGYDDIIAAQTNHEQTSGQVEVWLGTPSSGVWNWSLFTSLPSSPCPYKSVAADDYNEDGSNDIAACCSGSPGKVTVLSNFESGWVEQVVSESYDCAKIIAASINRDRWKDIAISTNGAGIRIWAHVIQGTSLGWTPFTAPTQSGTFSGLTAPDINLDGLTDIVAQETDPALRTRTWYQQPGNEWAEQANVDMDYECYAIASGDLNLDHYPDLVTACDNTSTGSHVLRPLYLYDLSAAPTLMLPTDGFEIITTREPHFELVTTSPYTDCLRYIIQIDGSDPIDFDPPDQNYPQYIWPRGWEQFCSPSSSVAAYNLQVSDNFPGGLPDGFYCWRAAAFDGYKLTEATLPWCFIINPTDKTAPIKTNELFLAKIPGGTELAWHKSEEPDVNRYRIFRGNTPDYTPLPSNGIAEINCPCPTVLYYEDTSSFGPMSFYQVKAVDTTGNQGP